MRFRAPRAICDRCSGRFYHYELTPQARWAGDHLVNTNWLVCERCLDEPNPGDRSPKARPDRNRPNERNRRTP